MENPSKESTIGILTVERSFTDFDDPYLGKDYDHCWIFIYEGNERSEKYIQLISNYFRVDGHLVESSSCPRGYLPHHKRLLESNVRIGLFPELFGTESGLTGLIANVLCEKNKRCERRLLLLTLNDTVIPSYLEFEDVVNLQRDGWMETLRKRFSFKAKTMVRSNSSRSHLDNVDPDGMKIQRYHRRTRDNADEGCMTHPQGKFRTYIVHGDTKAEVYTSKQITNLLFVAKGYVVRQVSTSDKNIVFLPQTVRSFPNSRQSTLILILDQIHGNKSKASDYGVLFREFNKITVLTIQLCDHKERQESHLPDNKQNDIKLNGRYKDWYRVILDEVDDVIRKTNQLISTCTLLNPVDDSAITIGARYQQRSTVNSRKYLHQKVDLPTIVAPEDHYLDVPIIYHSDGSQSSHLSSTWMFELDGDQGSDIRYLTPDSSVNPGSQHSLSSRLTYKEGEITDKERESQYKSMFDLFDADQDGSITLEEVCSVVENLGLDWGKDSIKTEMKKVDKDGNGMIEFNEFLTMMTSYNVDPEREIKQMFDIIDKDGDGSITAKEIWITWNRNGIPCTLEDVSIMIAAGDADHNGVIDFEEFKNIYKTLVAPSSFRRSSSTSVKDRLA